MGGSGTSINAFVDDWPRCHDGGVPDDVTFEAGAVTQPATAPVTGHAVGATFTGHGSEYFRIWVVNVLLTLLTLGLYSAWAKVRKATYFRRNTWIDGHVFDYHGNPVAVLRGRLAAVVLLSAYTWAFQFSNAAGVLTVTVLCATGPWLFMRAQQFSLANTSFRGLRFGFRARAGEAYWTVLPVLVLWFVPMVDAAFMRGEAWIYWTPTVVTIFAWPWMHHRLKAYQRRNAMYGDRGFTFTPATLRFYAVYAKGLGFVVLGGALAVTSIGVAFAWWHGSRMLLVPSRTEAWIYGALAALAFYVVAWPYYAARLQHVVWSRTRLGEIHFRSEIKARPLLRIVLKNVGLTLLTGGVYWPWATMAMARYRIQCVHIESGVPLSALAASVAARPVTAAGEGTTDAFGFDIGL
ncbi:MAG: DUF898 domain-containing protein [Candidatus Rokuibacteriota bacterium]|nr:MAG: DUF898 domain-containing protein [Candidatus Rokubacteria bacterium]